VPRPRPAPPSLGLREQFGQTRRAARQLVGAHVRLLKAELGEIAGQLKLLAALAGVLLAIGLYVANLLLIGGSLFLGEWLFGSIGWGVLHGTLLGIGLMAGVALVLFGAPAGMVLTRWLAAALVAVLVTVALALNLARQGAVAGAEQVRAGLVPTLDPSWAPAVVAAAAGAIVIGLVLLIVGARAGVVGGIVGLLVGALVGALLGLLLGGSEFDWRIAAAIGVAVGALLWPILLVQAALGAGIDPKKRFTRLWPRETYETALETKAWLEQEWAKRRDRLGRRS
jgi:hypothetical protein